MAKSKADAVCISLARQIRKERLAREISMYAIAKRAGIAHSTITRIENETMNPTIDMLVRVAEAMEMELWPLVKDAENKANKLLRSKT